MKAKRLWVFEESGWQLIFQSIVLVAAVGVWGGCSQQVAKEERSAVGKPGDEIGLRPPPPPPSELPPPPPPEALIPPAPPDMPGQEAEERGNETPRSAEPSPPELPAAPPPAPPVAPPAPQAEQHTIALSTGVALPQTGPEGTLMSFSVDYEVIAGEPDPKGYIWVIERAKGPPLRQPVRLAKKGNLPILVPGWRPEDGPFHTYFEDQAGRRVSPTIELL